MKKRTMLTAMLVVCAMLIMMLAPASAEKIYTTTLVTDANDDGVVDHDPTTVLKKNLILDNNANIPAVEFTFTASVPEATSEVNPKLVCDATDDTLAVMKGLNPDKIRWITDDDEEDQASGEIGEQGESGVITYAAIDKDDADPDTADGDYITVTTGKAGAEDSDTQYTATKNITLDFTECGFDEPGVYRYTITENTDPVQGVIFDENNTRTLDVYVKDMGTDDDEGNPELGIEGFVLYVGTITEGPSNQTENIQNTEDTDVQLEDGTTNKNTNGTEVSGADKSVGFVNEYITHELLFSKDVSGNQGSRDKYFKFTLSIENAGAGSLFDISYADDGDDSTLDGFADEEIDANPNSATTVITEAVVQPEQLETDENGAVSQVFYLQHGQHIVVRGIPEDASYEIVEDEEDYTPSVLVIGDGVDEGDLDDDEDDVDIEGGETNSVSDSALKDDTVVAYTNDRSGLIPTGVKLPVIPIVVSGILLAGGIVLLLVKKERE